MTPDDPIEARVDALEAAIWGYSQAVGAYGGFNSHSNGQRIALERALIDLRAAISAAKTPKTSPAGDEITLEPGSEPAKQS